MVEDNTAPLLKSLTVFTFSVPLIESALKEF